MAGKSNPVSSISSQFSSIQRSLLTLSSLTLILFTYISFKSLHILFITVSNFSDIYHSHEIFRLNYAEMEKNFKVFIYPDGDPNTFYQTLENSQGNMPVRVFSFRIFGKVSSVRRLQSLLIFFFIPISCHKMRGKGTSYANMTIIVKNYVDSLILKYPYWNRTLELIIFSLPVTMSVIRFELYVPESYDVGFVPHKDVALPQVLQPFALPAGGNDIRNRTTLGFWAGHRNSKIRVVLARVWENDTELDIKNNRINRTKFCICPGGFQVNSARITDAIHYGCVPVILSDYYDLPFNDILNWRKFSVILKENDVYQLKGILKDIPEEQFVALHKNVVKVQKHFQWKSPPTRYDAFHMVMYELWLGHLVIRY
ncbi:hypothetical protein MKW92_007916 [Papaver armeniacum]|nr:hypothetical protein MKW92_007916 [Papaver armeniacum]